MEIYHLLNGGNVMKYKFNNRVIKPCLYSCDNIITEANKEFIKFTGYALDELLGKSLIEIGVMIRINSQILLDNISGKYSGYVFTKSLSAREVNISLFYGKEANEKIYTFVEKLNSRLDDKLIFEKQILSDNIVGIAIYSVPDLIMVKANQKYLDFQDFPFNEQETCIGLTIREIITGYVGTESENITKTVIESRKSSYRKAIKFEKFKRGTTYWDSNRTPIFENGIMKYIMFTTSDATERVLKNQRIERQNKMIVQQNQKLESIIENMPDAFLIYNKHGEITHFNPEARKLYPEIDSLTNRDTIYNGFQYYNLDNKIILKENIPTMRAFRGEKIRNERIVIKRTDKLKITEVNATPIFNKRNELVSVVVLHHDISEVVNNEFYIKKQQELLLITEKEKNEALKDAIKIKDDFLYLITHELKTPLAVISLALQAIEHLCSTEVTEKLSNYLKIINQNTNRQLRLVENLLDITRMNSNQVKINISNSNIKYVVESVVNSVRVYAKQKNVNLKFTTDLRIMNIYFDEEKLERILLNLLSNALKFTPNSKSITVSLSIKKHKNTNMISVSVQDEGLGIPNDKQEVIFERFGQADTSLSRQAEGTGLGLYLVKLLVDVLGGEICLKSQLGKGSTFTIFLPIVKPINIDEIASCNEVNSKLMRSDNNVIQTAKIEFSDIYF